MNSCDIIMLSNTKSKKELDMTERALDSLFNSEKDKDIRVVLVETNSSVKDNFQNCYEKYPNLKLILPNEEFNFNRFVNMAIPYCHGNLVGILNNDVVFEPLWLTNIINAMDEYNLNSASSFCPTANTHRGLESKITLGWNVGREFAGWCIVIKRESLNKILPLDEQFKFWCVDNDMALDLHNLGFRHALVGNSIVHHLGGQTLFTESPQRINHLTGDMVKLFSKKRKQL